MSTLEVPGYQPLHIDCDGSATVWLYMGDNFVALSPGQWHRFARMVAVASDELSGAGSDVGAGPEPELEAQ
jgi:hypothetical protein